MIFYHIARNTVTLLLLRPGSDGGPPPASCRARSTPRGSFGGIADVIGERPHPYRQTRQLRLVAPTQASQDRAGRSMVVRLEQRHAGPRPPLPELQRRVELDGPVNAPREGMRTGRSS